LEAPSQDVGARELHLTIDGIDVGEIQLFLPDISYNLIWPYQVIDIQWKRGDRGYKGVDFIVALIYNMAKITNLATIAPRYS
jgi:hypothetical protein